MGPLMTPLLIMANVFGVGMIVPQAVRIHRTRIADGVSATWIGISLALNLGWFLYGVHGRLWGLIPVSAGALLLYGIVAAKLISITGSLGLRRVTTGVLGASVAPASALMAAGWIGLGLTLGLAYGLQFTPAVVSALRATSTGGISAATWIMALAEAVIWAIYGVAVSDWALILGGLGGTVMASIIVGRLALDRPTGRLAPAPMGPATLPR